ncbi:MAG TPA: hypothetical protein VMA34_22040 [Terracidiphilus sp.]|nr:hypothetical protein [Terracidiphilus sp.]
MLRKSRIVINGALAAATQGPAFLPALAIVIALKPSACAPRL